MPITKQLYVTQQVHQDATKSVCFTLDQSRRILLGSSDRQQASSDDVQMEKDSNESDLFTSIIDTAIQAKNELTSTLFSVFGVLEPVGKLCDPVI